MPAVDPDGVDGAADWAGTGVAGGALGAVALGEDSDDPEFDSSPELDLDDPGFPEPEVDAPELPEVDDPEPDVVPGVDGEPDEPDELDGADLVAVVLVV